MEVKKVRQEGTGERRMKRRIRNVFIILLSSVIIGTLFLVLTFCLPVDSARKHAEESLYEMIDVKDDENGSAFRKSLVELKVNFTDTLMVQNALEKVDGKSPLAHAMYIFHHDIQNDDTTWLTEESIGVFLAEGTDGLHLREYSKYWHGYLVYLKPLLMCMSWEAVEIFLILTQMILLVVIMAIAFYKKQPLLGLSVAGAFLFMKPVSVLVSLSMNMCWLITLTAVLVLLIFYDKIEQKNLREELFLLIGIATAYMDFLTYPIVTLGLPLCFYLVQDMDKVLHWWKRIKQAFWMCACWGVGYVGMWGMKWVVAEITCQTGTLRNAVWSVIYRTGPLDGYGSAFTGVPRTIRDVLAQYDSVVYSVMFVIIAAAAVVSSLLCLIKARNANWGVSVTCLAIVGLFPFVWLTLTQNHTAIHCAFTFRIMAVSIMALWCVTACSVRTLICASRRKVRENAVEIGEK